MEHWKAPSVKAWILASKVENPYVWGCNKPEIRSLNRCLKTSTNLIFYIWVSTCFIFEGRRTDLCLHCVIKKRWEHHREGGSMLWRWCDGLPSPDRKSMVYLQELLVVVTWCDTWWTQSYCVGSGGKSLKMVEGGFLFIWCKMSFYMSFWGRR